MNDVPPLLGIVIEPKIPGDRDRLACALRKLVAEDPSLHVVAEAGSHRAIIQGTGELKLQTKIDLLRHVHKIDVSAGAPQVLYRETITRAATVDYTHKRQMGGTGQYARIRIIAEPMPRGAGFTFENKIAGDSVLKAFVPAIEKGLESALAAGVLAGFMVVDLKVTLVDGASHDVDSSALAFEIAARAALREALMKAGPVLLEPIMRLEVTTPADDVASVIGDLNFRRAHIESQDVRDDTTVIRALVPLATMLGYVNALRSLAGGRAIFARWFSHYAPVPPDDDGPLRPAIGMRA